MFFIKITAKFYQNNTKNVINVDKFEKINYTYRNKITMLNAKSSLCDVTIKRGVGWCKTFVIIKMNYIAGVVRMTWRHKLN